MTFATGALRPVPAAGWGLWELPLAGALHWLVPTCHTQPCAGT